MRAYVQLAVAPDHADGVGAVTLFRLGSLEVRLTETAQNIVRACRRSGWSSAHR